MPRYVQMGKLDAGIFSGDGQSDAMGATLSAATCTIFGPTFPVQSNAIALRFAD